MKLLICAIFVSLAFGGCYTQLAIDWNREVFVNPTPTPPEPLPPPRPRPPWPDPVPPHNPIVVIVTNPPVGSTPSVVQTPHRESGPQRTPDSGDSNLPAPPTRPPRR